MFFSIFDRYLGKIILKSIIMMLFFFISLSVLIKFIDELHKIDQQVDNFLSLLLLILFSILADIDVLFPMCVLLGTLLGLGILVSRNELLAMESVGYGYFKIVYSICKSVVLIILFVVFFTEYMLPLSDNYARVVRIRLFSKHAVNIDMKNDLWIKNSGNFIFIERVINERKLFGISIYYFDKKDSGLQLNKVRYVQSASFIDGVWQLVMVDDYYFDDVDCLFIKHSLNELWKTTLTPEILLSIVTKLRSLSIFLLFKYIKYLDRDGQCSNIYKMRFWNKMFSPFSSLVMMFFGIAFMFKSFYNINTSVGIKMFCGVFFGFLFYVLNKFCGVLSVAYNVTPIVCSGIPIVVFLIIGMFILCRND